jgi:hypothetical protein
MLIESRVTQQLLSQATGRSLLDALESFEPEKTMWLAPPSVEKPNVKADERKPASPPAHDLLRTPKREEKVSAPHAAVIPSNLQDAEQLRAFLWDRPATAGQGGGPLDNVAWVDNPAPQSPPRPMPNAAPTLPPMELGAVVKGRYRLEAHLGFGGIGQVFKALDLELERAGHKNAFVTLKQIAVDLRHEPGALSAMQSAVQKIKSLRHPNIVSTYDVVADAERLCVIMEPLSGRWLGDLVRQVRGSGVARELAWPIVEGIAEGLAFAHELDIVHSDLSPYSVFLTETGQAKIMGFGLIHALPTSNEAMDLLDTMTLRAYSEAYTSDTWATHGTPQPADDLYPLGVIAYELFTGKHPFQRQSLTTARQKNLAYEPAKQLDSRARKLIDRCLSFERAERPKNGARFIERLQGPQWLRALFGRRVGAARSS